MRIAPTVSPTAPPTVSTAPALPTAPPDSSDPATPTLPLTIFPHPPPGAEIAIDVAAAWIRTLYECHLAHVASAEQSDRVAAHNAQHPDDPRQPFTADLNRFVTHHADNLRIADAAALTDQVEHLLSQSEINSIEQQFADQEIDRIEQQFAGLDAKGGGGRSTRGPSILLIFSPTLTPSPPTYTSVSQPQTSLVRNPPTTTTITTTRPNLTVTPAMMMAVTDHQTSSSRQSLPGGRNLNPTPIQAQMLTTGLPLPLTQNKPHQPGRCQCHLLISSVWSNKSNTPLLLLTATAVRSRLRLISQLLSSSSAMAELSTACPLPECNQLCAYAINTACTLPTS